MAKFTVLEVSLTAARTDKAEIFKQGQTIYGVTVLSLPAGSDARLLFGDNPVELAVEQGDEFYDDQGCPVEDGGLFLKNAAQPGVTLKLYVAMEPMRAGRP